MRKQLVFNLNWLVGGRAIRIIGTLLIGVWLARYLGPKDFGSLNFALSFVALFGMVGRLNLDPVAVRELTKYPDKENEILGCIFRLKLWGNIVAIVLLLPIAWLAQPDNPVFLLMVIMAAAGLLFNVIDTLDIFYQSKILTKYIVQSRIAAFLLFTVVRIGMILGGLAVVWFALAGTLELALAAGIITWIYFKQKYSISNWSWNPAVAKSIIKDGWPLVASAMLIVVHTRIDQVMIGQMLGAFDVGQYSAAIRISEAWLFLPGLTVQAVMPYFVKLREQNAVRYQQRLMQLYSAMFWIGTVMGIAAILFGRPAILYLFGEAYSYTYGVLILTIWTGVFNAQAVVRGIWMISENLQLFRLFNNLIAVPLNIVLNYFWIPKYGINGAAFASLISIAAGTWVVPLLFKPLRKSNIDLMRSVNPRYLFVRN